MHDDDDNDDDDDDDAEMSGVRFGDDDEIGWGEDGRDEEDEDENEEDESEEEGEESDSSDSQAGNETIARLKNDLFADDEEVSDGKHKLYV